jgi:hypothetical protein
MSCVDSALFANVQAAFETRGFPERVALAATYFVLSTWFSGLLPVAPCLIVTGVAPEARFFLQLLGCFAHNPLPLSGLTSGGFLALDLTSEPTLLIDQENIGEVLWGLLRASNQRDAQTSTASGIRKMCCAKVIYVGNESSRAKADDSVLQVNMSPLRERLPFLESGDKQGLKAEFQPEMQAYHQRNFMQVRDSRFDLPELSSSIRILARALGAPIVAVPERQAALGALLREHQEAIQATVWFDPSCVVIEALLFWCHKRELERVHVGAISDTASAILQGRGENTPLEAKAVGSILRNLGMFPKRDRSGFAIRLDETLRRQIHRLAGQFAVATVKEGAMVCAHCAEFFPCEPAEETHAASNESRE